MPKTEAVEPIPQWKGFYPPNYTPVPDDFFDIVMPYLTDVELRVVLYIIRRTFGFKKQCDSISLTQITDGIVKDNGERLDHGAGVSRRGAQDAINRLEARGVIDVQRNRGADGRLLASTYSLRMAASPIAPNAIGYGNGRHRAMAAGANTLEQQVPIQETAVQETEKQEDQSSQSDNSSRSYTADDVVEAEPNVATGEYSPWIGGVVFDDSRELGAGANGATNVDKALRLWHRSGLTEATFVELLHQAKAAVRKTQGSGKRGRKIDLYFAELDRLMGEKTEH